MSYDTVCGGHSLGCFADLFHIIDGSEVEIFDILSYNYRMFENRDERLMAAARKVVSALPFGTFYDDEDQQNLALTKGHVTVTDQDDTLQLHMKFAPFRVFTELTGAIRVFEDTVDQSIMGAYILAHMCQTFDYDDDLVLMGHGWHQSALSGLNHDLINYRGSNNIVDKLVAHRIECRHLLAEPENVIHGYAIPRLTPSNHNRFDVALRAWVEANPCPIVWSEVRYNQCDRTSQVQRDQLPFLARWYGKMFAAIPMMLEVGNYAKRAA